MYKITLEGNDVNLEIPTLGIDLIKSILPKLRKKAIALSVNDKLSEINTTIDYDCDIQIVTLNSELGLDILRHTTSHLLAHAFKRISPQIKLGFGPTIEEGFYYDFLSNPVDDKVLSLVEEEMRRIIKMNYPIIRKEVSYEEALSIFQDEPLKIELIQEMHKKESTISVYSQDDFQDLCTGPHLSSTGRVQFFKLLKSSGAYWRGDSNNIQLQRVYGTAFQTKNELKNHLVELEKRKDYDHNKLGRTLDLFMLSPVVGQGLPLLTPKGSKLKQILQRFVEDEEERRGYQLTMTPLMAKSDLYKISGHWDHYKEDMFTFDVSDETMALRPMTCPFHFIIYKNKLRSYRDLPIRYNETSTLFRNESSGKMNGLIRVRQFTLSEGHIICRPDQLKDEFFGVLDLINFMMKAIGVKGHWFGFSKWDPDEQEKYIDNPEAWKMSEKILRDCLNEAKVEYVEAKGEAAFYGPKLDLQVKNIWGREDTLITVQFDFALPDRFELKYISQTGEAETPMVIHRSSIGCYERTIAFLLEQFEGRLPFWMAPEQIVIMNINDNSAAYAQEIHQRLLSEGIRTKIDLRKEKIHKKVRDAQKEYIPIMITTGDKEALDKVLSVRTLDGTIKYGITLNRFINFIQVLKKDYVLDIDIETM